MLKRNKREERDTLASRSRLGAPTWVLVFSYRIQMMSENTNIRQDHCLAKMDRDKSKAFLLTGLHIDNNTNVDQTKHKHAHMSTVLDIPGDNHIFTHLVLAWCHSSL
jgi:hypothetical protein